MKSKFASLIACGVVALTAAVLPANAVTPVNIAFDIIWVAPLPNGDTMSWGSVTYNGEVVPMSGGITITAADPAFISLFVSVNGVDYTQVDDGAYPSFPTLSFFDGELIQFDFLDSTFSVNLSDVGLGNQGAYLDTGTALILGDIVLKGPTTVPDAGSTAAMLGVAFCAAGALRRRLSA